MRAASLALALLLASSSALAAAAPGLDWRTIRSKCCDVHYPKELEPVARRAANIADDAVAHSSAFLESAPRERIQLVLHDVTDSPNGFTSSVPYDLVDLRAITPEGDSDLAVTDEWLRLLIEHEVLHVVHLDTIHGLPLLVDIVIGKVWPPNIVQPRFVVEGLATYAETKYTRGGRLRSTFFHSDILLGAFAGDLWQLDDLSSYSRRSPSGGAAYAYGAAFVEWLSLRYGDRIWPAIAHDYGGRAIPYAVQRSIESVTGHDLEEDYQLFLDDVREEARILRELQQARGGPTRARRLTHLGGNMRGPRFASDGTLYLGIDPPNAPAGIYAIRGLPDEVPVLEPVVRTTEAADVAVVDGGLWLTQTETSRGWFAFHDVYRVDFTGAGADKADSFGTSVVIQGGALREPGASSAQPSAPARPLPVVTRVTREARVRAISALPGGAVVGERRTASDAALTVVDDAGNLRDIVRADDGTMWFTPDVSPDARRVAASKWSPGGARDIVIVDIDSGAETHLTSDGAQDLEPAWTVDGEHVLFASDREGLFQIYAVNVRDRVIRRLVDTLGIARHPRPTPDGRGLLYVDTHVEGHDLYATSLDIANAPIVTAAPPAPPRRDATPPSTAPEERYNPLPSLRPYYWTPLLAADPLGGVALGAAVVGEDAAGLLSWAAQATYGFALERPRVSASVRYADIPTPLSVNGEWRTDHSASIRRTDGVPDAQQETVLRLSSSLSLPFARTRRHTNSISLGYSREWHFIENPLTSPPDARAPVYPPSGNIGSVTLDWSYFGIESYRDSISTERGFSSFLRLRHANPLFTGSDLALTEVTADTRFFRPVPGLGGHVVALYMSGGVAFGERLRRTRFGIGGFENRDITGDLLDGLRSSSGVLRGHPAVAVVGDATMFSTLEYRFPILEVERGVSTLPIFFERVHGAVFTDMGTSFDTVFVPTRMRVSLGSELRFQINLGYYGFFLVRAGFARGVGAGGVDQPYVVMGFPY